jgi:hypothetical protein
VTNFREGIGMLVIPTRVKVVVVMVCALALAGGLLTLTLLAKPAQAQAETFTDTDRSTFTFYTSSCTGDDLVFFEGTEQIVAHTTIDANGVYHTKGQYKLQGQGEGLDSGDKYVYNYVSDYHENYSLAPGENYNFTQTLNVKIIRQGADTTTDDLQGKALFHVTIDENGEVTAVVENFEVVCT